MHERTRSMALYRCPVRTAWTGGSGSTLAIPGSTARIRYRYPIQFKSVVRPGDIYVLAGLLANEGDWTYRQLAADLRVPHPVVQRALARAAEAGLYSDSQRKVHLPHFEEFAVHALRFVAPVSLGPIVPGVPAGWAAPPMSALIRSSGDEPPPVWPTAHGRVVRGQALEPLHPAAVEAAPEHEELSAWLSILDSLRAGDVRVRRVAGGQLKKRMRAVPARRA